MTKICFFIVFSLLFFSCSTTSVKQSEQAEISRNSSSSQAFKYELTAKGEKITYDSNLYDLKRYDVNKDKRPDIINVFKKVPNEKGGHDLHIFLKMMDLNHDSKIDIWRYFDDESGAVEREELDFDFDGKIDRVDYFSNGIVRKSEFNFQFDEKPDIIKNYDEEGIVVLLEADQNGDGMTDYWEYYRNGVVERVEKDTDSDGVADVFRKPGDVGFTTIVDIGQKFEVTTVPDIKENPEDEIVEQVRAAEGQQSETKQESATEVRPAESEPDKNADSTDNTLEPGHEADSEK